MKKYLALATLVLSFKALACPELDSIDFHTDETDPDPRYEVLATSVKATLSKEEIKALGDIGINADRCVGNMSYDIIRSTETQKVYTVLTSHADECDGGNAMGVVFRLGKKVADVGDSFIYCL